MKDLSISRTSFTWGVPVPGHTGHIMYVWIDALINYISALGYPGESGGKFRKFWPALHVVGKDILRFHAVYWPAFLMAAGVEPPRRVFAHGWWTNEGQKISKSLGNVIDPFKLVEEFGIDPVRYFLMREVPFGNDGDFSRAAFIHRNNGDLANDFGNLAQRTLTQINRNCGAKVPPAKALKPKDRALLEGIAHALEKARKHLEVEAIHLYLEEVWRQVALANGYISGEEPWTLKKTDPKRMEAVLYTTAEALRRLAILAQPVMPGSMAGLLDLLAVPENARTFAYIGEKGALKPGAKLPEPKAIFPRIKAEG